ncbi:hypothetical protein AB0D30_30120 [Streptomyces sp. NPDC048409]|uniref:hypothetical protein n=1 Tax=Streptomyces sp. NPDC048409 TaxID=3154723 RepID=UPI00342F6CAE
MHAIRLASAALLGIGALVLGAPAALTDDESGGDRDAGRQASFGVRVTPSTVTAGGRISLQVSRDESCRGAATVSSDVFDTVRIPEGRDSVAATVRRDARSQTSYRVTVDCDGTRGSTELSIAGTQSSGRVDDGTGVRADGRTDGATDGQSGVHTGSRTDGLTDDGSDDLTGSGTQPLQPDRGVRAGAGGSVAGFDLKEIGLGALLVTASVGTAYRIARRRAGEDGA